MIHTAFEKNQSRLEWAEPLYFRLTDAYALNDSILIGINHLFTSNIPHFERDAYIKDLEIQKCESQLTNGGNIDTCFTQIIKTNQSGIIN